MKKLFYSVFVMVLLFTSCSKEEEFEDIVGENAVTTRTGEASVYVSHKDNILYFTWDNRFVASVSIAVTNSDGYQITYDFPNSTTLDLHSDAFFRIDVSYTEAFGDYIPHGETYFRDEFGQLYEPGAQPECNHRCFDRFPDNVRMFGNSIELDMVGEYTMITYSPSHSAEHGAEHRKDFTIEPPQSWRPGTLVPITRLVSENNVAQKVRIFTKDCPYGPGVCTSFIEADIPLGDYQSEPSSPTGSAYFHYCNHYGWN